MERDQFHCLPLDIVPTILSHCRYERETQSSCSLVCKAWVPFSRYHLFRHRVVTIVSHKEAAVIIDLLDNPRSTIAPFIRNVRLNIYEDESFDPEVARALEVMHEKDVNIQSLFLAFSPYWQHSRGSFDLLRPLLAQTAKRIDFTLTTYLEPTTLCTLAGLSPSIRHLSLDLNVEFFQDRTPSTPTPPNALHIYTYCMILRGYDFGHFSRWFRAYCTLPYLTHLNIRLDYMAPDASGFGELQELLKTVSCSLEHLFLTWEFSSVVVEGLDLSRFSSLHTLQMGFSDQTDSQTVANIVFSCRHSRALRSLVLLRNIDGYAMLARHDAWKDLDVSLSNRDDRNFTFLREIVLRPDMIPLFPKSRLKGIVREAEGKFPFKARWYAALERAYDL